MATDPKFSLRAWLSSFNREKYVAVFEQHGVVSHEQCSSLVREGLLRLGITDANDVREILLEADDLKCNSLSFITRVLLHEPLYAACKAGDMDKVKWLIEEGANVNWKNKHEKQKTCLLITAIKGHTEILNYLVHLPEVIVDIRDMDGNTVAHYSARNGHLNVVELLYQHDKALFSLKNKADCTPLEEAERCKQTSVVSYISAQSNCERSSMIRSDSASSSAKISNPPTLLTLMRMKEEGKAINIVKNLAAGDYKSFGMSLLHDENGVEVDLIKKAHIQEGAESVTQAILQKWLSSDTSTCTYQHLIECLKEAELGALAAKVANCCTYY